MKARSNAYECMAVQSQSKSYNQKSNSIKKRSNIATFNVRGMNETIKRIQLAQDLARYQVDICCLQEKLGTLLGDCEQICRRKQLASAAFNNLKRLWSRNKNIKVETSTRLKLYNAYIIPIMTYNACTSALTDTELQELEAFRRKQLTISDRCLLSSTSFKLNPL
jgi:hypothetical protein